MQKEQEIIYLYDIKKMRPKDIVLRLKVSKQLVNYYIRKFESKKVKISDGGTLVFSKNSITKELQKSTGKWRAENIFFKLKPYYVTDRYNEIRRERGNYGIPEGRYTMMLYRDHIRIQSREGAFFYADTREEALKKVQDDFTAFIDKVKYKYGFYPEKEGRVSIKLCSMELAKEQCRIAEKHQEQTGESFYYVHDSRGKVIFKFDKSRGPFEREYIGAETVENSENGERFFRDIFANDPLPPTEIQQRQDWIMDTLKAYSDNMARHISVMEQMEKTLKDISEATKSSLPGYPKWMRKQ